MNDTTQFIYSTQAIGLCRPDLPEKSRKFSHMECLRCRAIPKAKASAELCALAGEVKRTNESKSN
jgi:hypothetical protein